MLSPAWNQDKASELSRWPTTSVVGAMAAPMENKRPVKDLRLRRQGDGTGRLRSRGGEALGRACRGPRALCVPMEARTPAGSDHARPTPMPGPITHPSTSLHQGRMPSRPSVTPNASAVCCHRFPALAARKSRPSLRVPEVWKASVALSRTMRGKFADVLLVSTETMALAT